MPQSSGVLTTETHGQTNMFTPLVEVVRIHPVAREAHRDIDHSLPALP